MITSDSKAHETVDTTESRHTKRSTQPRRIEGKAGSAPGCPGASGPQAPDSKSGERTNSRPREVQAPTLEGPAPETP